MGYWGSRQTRLSLVPPNPPATTKLSFPPSTILSPPTTYPQFLSPPSEKPLSTPLNLFHNVQERSAAVWPRRDRRRCHWQNRFGEPILIQLGSIHRHQSRSDPEVSLNGCSRINCSLEMATATVVARLNPRVQSLTNFASSTGPRGCSRPPGLCFQADPFICR